MPLRKKYSITDWVLSQDHLKVGDKIAFFDEFIQKEVEAEVIELPSHSRQVIICKRDPIRSIEVINFYNTITYKVKDRAPINNCCCGASKVHGKDCAKRYHAAYCEKSK